MLIYHRLETDDYSPFWYRSKTLLSLFCLLVILNSFATSDTLSNFADRVTQIQNESTINKKAFAEDELIVKGSMESRGALMGVGIAYLGFAMIHFPDTTMVRPHPLFWRAILGVISIYAFLMTYIFLLPIDEARSTLQYFDASLGRPLPEKNYAEDCRVYTPENPESNFYNVKDAIFDCHFVAHFLGWWGKMMIVRDWHLAWTCSIMFEVCEITFRHWLLNFWECWWDSLLLDVFGCNMIGLLLGAKTLEYLQV